MKLQYLSKNLVSLLNEILENNSDGSINDIVRLVCIDDYDSLSRNLSTNPIELKDQYGEVFQISNTKEAIGIRFFPYHYPTYEDDTRTELRVYFPSLFFKNGGVIEDTDIHFDILTHTDLYFVDSEDSSELLVRPHTIAQKVIDKFDGKSIGKLGRLEFDKILNLSPSEKYQVTRVVASLYTLGV